MSASNSQRLTDAMVRKALSAARGSALLWDSEVKGFCLRVSPGGGSVFDLPKLASAVIAAGARVAWDDTAKQVVLPGTGMVPIGIATLAAGNGVSTVRVWLDGVSTEAA